MNSRGFRLSVLLLPVLLGFLHQGPRAATAVERLQVGGFADASQASLGSAIRVNLTDAAANNGAVCLDGTPATYYYYSGTGEGSNNWLVFLQGGGWCSDLISCALRAGTSLGSTSFEGVNSIGFHGILGENRSLNPDFYNWNLVFVRYCDGASFSGDVDLPVQVSPEGQKIYFRGQRIWDAVMTDLLQNRGMKKAEHALLAGCSAGGLSTLIHCDQFRATMPKTTCIKCLSDAGFFLDQINVEGIYALRERFSSVVSLQNVAANLHPGCTSSRQEGTLWECFFPQYFIQYVKTPIYILNSGYDSWQISNSLIPVQDWQPKNGKWAVCYSNFALCSKYQLEIILDFWNHMVSILNQLMTEALEQGGIFIVSRRVHCMSTQSWNGGGNAVQINNTVPAKAFGDWYFGRKGTSRLQVDNALPSNCCCLPASSLG